MTIVSRRRRCLFTPPRSTATCPISSAQLHAVVKRQFGLDNATTDELLAEGTQAEREAVDLYHFTSLINRSIDDEGRRRIVEMMWEIIYADGRANEFESNLMWRTADMPARMTAV